MRNYARIEENSVREVIEIPDDADIKNLYHPSLIWVETTGLDPLPKSTWTYIDGVFAPPVPFVKTPEMIRAENAGHRDYLLSIAALAIAPLQDAVDLDEATDSERAALLVWKKFRIAVNRVILTIENVAWPDFPPQHYAAQPESDV